MEAPSPPPPVRLLTRVLVACDAALRGQLELLLVVQDFLLPLVEIGPAAALRIGGARLLSLWLDAAAFHGAGIDEYTGAALFTAVRESGVAFLDRAIGDARVAGDVWTSVANFAARNSAQDVLEALHARLPSLEASYVLEIATVSGDMALVRWLHKHEFGGCVVTERMLTRAAAKGHLEIVQWWVEETAKSSPHKLWMVRRAMDYAAKYGQFDVLRWLRAHTDFWWSRHAIGAALTGGHFEMADWMFELNQARLAEGTFDQYDPSSPVLDLTNTKQEAFTKGDLSVLRWLHERELLKTITGKFVERAMVAGHVHVLEFVAQYFPDSKALSFTSRCAAGGSIPAAQWAMLRQGLPNSAALIHVAASHGHIEFVRWYWATFNGQVAFAFDRLAVETAAEHGHLDCVQFLLEKKYSVVTDDAIVNAARNGHLAVVQFLTKSLRTDPRHENLTEDGEERDERVRLRCLGSAMNEAAENGHIVIVRWICDLQLGFEIDRSTIWIAAALGRFEMVQFLVKHIRDKSDHRRAVIEAAKQGHLRVVKFLLSHSPLSHDECRIPAQRARRRGHTHVAKWVEVHGWKEA